MFQSSDHLRWQGHSHELLVQFFVSVRVATVSVGIVLVGHAEINELIRLIGILIYHYFYVFEGYVSVDQACLLVFKEYLSHLVDQLL